MAHDMVRLDGTRLDEARVHRGWTRRHLGKLAGISQDPLRKALAGNAVGLTVASSVTKALGVQVGDVLVARVMREQGTQSRDKSRVAS